MIRQKRRTDMKQSKPLLITQSLLSSWLYVYKTDDGYEKFIDSLHRKKQNPTKAMLDGIQFESMVNAVCNGQPMDKSHKWIKGIEQVVPIVKGAQQQVKVSKDVNINGVNFILYGILDFLKAGVIYDTKFSKTYSLNKYLDSPQHPMYFALVPEARRFEYIICDGIWVYRECYDKEDAIPIEEIINNFMKFLDRYDLLKTYCENWRSKY